MPKKYQIKDNTIVNIINAPDDFVIEGYTIIDADAGADIGYSWNGTEWVAPEEPTTPKTISIGEFKFLFTDAERLAIRTEAKTDIIIEDWLDLLNSFPTIDLNSDRAQNGVKYLVSKGLLTQLRGQEILNPQAKAINE